ncbi:MAG: polya polymerase, partial [Ruminococcus sp.]|nr:polya polymerase [Ruminococcus sp.]
MNLKIPYNVEKILERLHKNNHKAYVVGGCVRDSLLKKTPHDWDICTDALPEEIISCFKEYSVVPTGLKHGTVSVIINHTPYEITTFRTESSYSDHRRPDSIKFVRSLKEDLSRRDFTINAMAYNIEEGFFDYFGGQSDLKNKCIRCVGNPEKRFTEDALRILRCIRFASTYSFYIDTETEKAIFSCAKYLKYISKERIQHELCGFLCGNGCTEILRNYKEIIFLIIPALKPLDGFNQHNLYHKYDVWNHTIETIHNTPSNDFVLRLSALLHDIGK